MSRYTSLQKKERRDILQKAVLAMLATGVMAWPSFSPVYAADFTGHDGHIENTDNVHNIYAGSSVGTNVGVNKFTKFDVLQNEIANLQLVERICGDVLKAILKPGDKLPSVRELAVDAGVNVNTVQRVYKELELMNLTE